MRKLGKILSIFAILTITVLLAACGKDRAESAVEPLFRHGTWTDDTYTSEFLGFQASFGSEWDVTPDAELARTQAAADLSDDNVRAVIDRTGTFTELSAASRNGTIITITAENNTVSGCADEFAFFTSGLEDIRQEIAADGFQVGSVFESHTTFLGENVRCAGVIMTVPEYDRAVYQIRIPIFKGDCTAVVTFTALNEADLEGLVGMFSAA